MSVARLGHTCNAYEPACPGTAQRPHLPYAR